MSERRQIYKSGVRESTEKSSHGQVLIDEMALTVGMYSMEIKGTKKDLSVEVGGSICQEKKKGICFFNIEDKIQGIQEPAGHQVLDTFCNYQLR